MNDLDTQNRDDRDWIDEYLREIIRYHRRIQKVPEEMHVQIIDLKSKQLVFIGKLAAEFAERYKMIRAAKMQEHAEVYLKTEKNKKQVADLAVSELRKEEAEAYGNWIRWKNAMESTKEEINALKYKVRLDFADGSRQN